VQLGHLFFQGGNLEEAATAYDQALTLYPNYVHALAGQARVAAARGDYASAIQRYEQAAEVAPLLDLVIQLAELYAAAGHPEDAARARALVRVQQRLYAANGVETDVDLILFEVDHGGDVAEAVARARRELARRPTTKAADALAWALFHAGQCAEADAHASEALRLGTRDPLLLYHAGRIADCAGDSVRAARLLGEALTLNPSFSPRHAPEARQALQALAVR
jgi:tetratricopeptide (TPR) repeat protein